MSAATFEGWAILELMGHRKLAGRISEATIGGGAFIRIDVPGESADIATQFYAPGAVYCITPCTEDLARRTAAGCRPAPVTEYELPSRRLPSPPTDPYPADDEDGNPNVFTCDGCREDFNAIQRHEVMETSTEETLELCNECFRDSNATPTPSEPPSADPGSREVDF